MVLTSGRPFRVVYMLVLIFVSGTECKGGRSSGGHSSHSSGHSSHSSSHSSGTSHSSSGSSHTSSGGSHTSHGGDSHTSGTGTYTYGGSSGHYASPNHSPGYSHPANSHPIGFDHVNQNAHNALYGSHPSHPYNPQTVVHPGGYVHYKPPTSLQYTHPATSTIVHHVPVYHPSVIHTPQTSIDSGHASSFLGGYLVGRMSHGHTNNNYYSTNSDTGGYYTVHHHHQNREQVPSSFSVTGEELTTCDPAITNDLCVPNTNAFCLKNGTIMCTTPTSLTSICEENSTDRCVYSRVTCNPNLACNTAENQTYVEFYLPCISTVTYKHNMIFDDTFYDTRGSYDLCVTAVAHPKPLESPFGAVVNFMTELGKWHMDQLVDIHNLTNQNPSDGKDSV